MTRYHTVMQGKIENNCNYVVIDPKGATFKSLTSILENAGYEVSLLNLIEKEKDGKKE